MRFEHFERSLESFSSWELPGIEAHDVILPAIARERAVALQRDPNPKISAVAITLYPKNSEAHVLLIERETYNGVHSNQVGFPGGKQENSDRDLWHTALREMEEEVGLSQQLPTLVRSMSEVYIPPSRFLVYPFVCLVRQMPYLVKDNREVKRIIELPVSALLDDSNIVEGKIKMAGGVYIKTPYLAYEDYKIWGATAMMLSELRQLLKAIER